MDMKRLWFWSRIQWICRWAAPRGFPLNEEDVACPHRWEAGREGGTWSLLKSLSTIALRTPTPSAEGLMSAPMNQPVKMILKTCLPARFLQESSLTDVLII